MLITAAVALLVSLPAWSVPNEYPAGENAIDMPGGRYRLDGYTCTYPLLMDDTGDAAEKKKQRALEVRKALERAALRVQSDLLACLNDVNPKAAHAFAGYLSKERPLIRCAGRPAMQRQLRLESTGKAEKSSASTDFDDRLGANADATNHTITLWTADPWVNDGLRAPAKDLIVPVPADAPRLERMKARIKNYPAYQNSYPGVDHEPQLMSLLFHESMHFI